MNSSLTIKRRAVDFAVWDGPFFVGRVRRLPNGWQAWDTYGEFVGWGHSLRAAAANLGGVA